MTERTPSLASKVVSGGASLLLAQGLGILLTFGAQRIILSTLTKEANGDLFVERRIADLLVAILCDAGLNAVAMRKMARMPERVAEIVSSVAAFRTGMWIVATLAAVVYGWAGGHDVVNIAIWSCYLMIAGRTGLLRYAMELPHRARVRFGLVSSLSVLDALLFLAIIWAIRDALTARSIIIAFLASVIPSGIILTIADRGRHMRPGRASSDMVRSLVREALPVMLAVAFVNVHDKIDAMMLEWFSTPTELGVFSAAYQSMAPFIGTIPVAAVMAIVPAISRLSIDDPDKCRQFATTGLRMLIASAIGIATVASIATPWIIELVSKGRYADNQGQFFVFLWMVVPIFILFYVQELNIALGAQRKNVVIAAILAVVTIVVGLLLIPTYASYGAIGAKFTAIMVGAGIAYAMFHRVLGQSLTLWPAVGAVIAAGACVASAYMLPSIMPRPAAIIAGVVIWGVAVMASGLVRPDDLRQLRTTMRSGT
jgi:O-antigen/teichoic acid export membrane protein